ncbi:hypothetical protein A2U01_0046776, partial [Trifolium medium]|nr:hypothetical protein [Trifolium medium]
MFEGLAGESQHDDPALEDFWDAMIQSMTKKGKAPQKTRCVDGAHSAPGTFSSCLSVCRFVII